MKTPSIFRKPKIVFFEDCADLEYRNCAQGLRSSVGAHYTTSGTVISTGEDPPVEKSRSPGTRFGDPKSATWPFWVEKRRLDYNFTNYIQQGKDEDPLACAYPQIKTVPCSSLNLVTFFLEINSQNQSNLTRSQNKGETDKKRFECSTFSVEILFFGPVQDWMGVQK